ncbi:MAG: hypothetical protein PHR28_14105 [candidate division Zixibacteria bacterium]|jgi:hypothetical protein|nr:hypothetical protein [candidate division Zixibacteria bacterium]
MDGRRGLVFFGIGLVLHAVMVFGLIAIVAYLATPIQNWFGVRVLQILPPALVVGIILVGAMVFGILGASGA